MLVRNSIGVSAKNILNPINVAVADDVMTSTAFGVGVNARPDRQRSLRDDRPSRSATLIEVEQDSVSGTAWAVERQPF